jgi:hypothetical protein
MATGADAKLGVQSPQNGRGLLVTFTIDNESPPGAWEKEMKRAPWAFGQPQKLSIETAIARIRLAGLGREADVLAAAILDAKASCAKTGEPHT